MIPFLKTHCRTNNQSLGSLKHPSSFHPACLWIRFEASANRCRWEWSQFFIHLFLLYCLLLKLELALLQLSS